MGVPKSFNLSSWKLLIRTSSHTNSLQLFFFQACYYEGLQYHKEYIKRKFFLCLSQRYWVYCNLSCRHSLKSFPCIWFYGNQCGNLSNLSLSKGILRPWKCWDQIELSIILIQTISIFPQMPYECSTRSFKTKRHHKLNKLLWVANTAFNWAL